MNNLPERTISRLIQGQWISFTRTFALVQKRIPMLCNDIECGWRIFHFRRSSIPMRKIHNMLGEDSLRLELIVVNTSIFLRKADRVTCIEEHTYHYPCECCRTDECFMDTTAELPIISFCRSPANSDKMIQLLHDSDLNLTDEYSFKKAEAHRHIHS
jgi:hypothetical protein